MLANVARCRNVSRHSCADAAANIFRTGACWFSLCAAESTAAINLKALCPDVFAAVAKMPQRSSIPIARKASSDAELRLIVSSSSTTTTFSSSAGVKNRPAKSLNSTATELGIRSISGISSPWWIDRPSGLQIGRFSAETMCRAHPI